MATFDKEENCFSFKEKLTTKALNERLDTLLFLKDFEGPEGTYKYLQGPTVTFSDLK